MNQVKLELSELSVESFNTTEMPDGSRDGTVHGQNETDKQLDNTFYSCKYTGCDQTACTCSEVIACESRRLKEW